MTARTRIERDFEPAAVERTVASATTDVSISGPELAGQAIEAGLVDEILLVVHPVVVRAGKPAFPPGLRLDLGTPRGAPLRRLWRGEPALPGEAGAALATAAGSASEQPAAERQAHQPEWPQGAERGRQQGPTAQSEADNLALGACECQPTPLSLALARPEC